MRSFAPALTTHRILPCNWWRRTGSNRRPTACKAVALPAELRPPSVARAIRSRHTNPPARAEGVRATPRKQPIISIRKGMRRRRPTIRRSWSTSFLRKEVIQPQVPLRLPCYDFTPVADLTVAGCSPCGLAHHLRVKPTPMV